MDVDVGTLLIVLKGVSPNSLSLVLQSVYPTEFHKP